MAIRLSEIVEALELLSDDMEYVYDVVDQNILLVWDGMVDGEYNPQLYKEIMEDWDERYLFLPGRHEMNEYGMMEDFIESVTSDRKREILFNAIEIISSLHLAQPQQSVFLNKSSTFSSTIISMMFLYIKTPRFFILKVFQLRYQFFSRFLLCLKYQQAQYRRRG